MYVCMVGWWLHISCTNKLQQLHTSLKIHVTDYTVGPPMAQISDACTCMEHQLLLKLPGNRFASVIDSIGVMNTWCIIQVLFLPSMYATPDRAWWAHFAMPLQGVPTMFAQELHTLKTGTILELYIMCSSRQLNRWHMQIGFQAVSTEADVPCMCMHR